MFFCWIDSASAPTESRSIWYVISYPRNPSCLTGPFGGVSFHRFHRLPPPIDYCYSPRLYQLRYTAYTFFCRMSIRLWKNQAADKEFFRTQPPAEPCRGTGKENWIFSCYLKKFYAGKSEKIPNIFGEKSKDFAIKIFTRFCRCYIFKIKDTEH